ncbi:MAG TPA: zf-HC2 domain-containing protein [Pyrinomonadaceae bacterium]|jgi:hypothetical protein|nr:zf-HC2 domain-containing protein [Pyrinomonadaceae bacterium]
MTCEELQFNLSFYLEDELTADERTAVESHVDVCPLCRIKLAEYQELSRELRTAAAPAISDSLVHSIQNTLRVELAVQKKQPVRSLRAKLQEWLEPRVLPYGVGTFASLTLFSLLTLGIMLPASDLNEREQTVSRASIDGATFRYAAERSDVAQESPSLNPNGALVAMTAAMAHSGRKNKEIVLVADVFSDGLARISEVVQSSPDEKTMQALEKAMEQVPETSPAFVPARLDGRSDVVQIVLKIHEVDVTSPDARPVRKPRLRYRQAASLD